MLFCFLLVCFAVFLLICFLDIVKHVLENMLNWFYTILFYLKLFAYVVGVSCMTREACCRVGVVRAPYLCGRRVTVATSRTAATATAIQTASTRCPSAASPSRGSDPGTSRNARPRSPPRTAAARTLRNRL